MHMVCKKDFNKAELETVRISKNPTTVGDGNAMDSARNLGAVTLGPAVKNHISFKNGKNLSELCTIRCFWFIDEVFYFIIFYFVYVFIAGDCD